MIVAAAMNPEALGGLSDSIARLRRGEPDALTTAILHYQHRLFRYLVRLVQDPATADDLFQQTWLLVLEKIGRYDSRRSFEPWLFSVAHNLAIDYLRMKPGESLDVIDASGSTEPAQVAELPAIHREVLTLRFEEGMKLEEISEVAAVPLSTVKSRLQRALEGLRSRLQARYAGGRRA